MPMSMPIEINRDLLVYGLFLRIYNKKMTFYLLEYSECKVIYFMCKDSQFLVHEQHKKIGPCFGLWVSSA